MDDRISVNIPFPGFYESHYSAEIDDVAEREAEYFANERQDEDSIAPELRLTAEEYGEILFNVTDYSAAYLTLSRDYCEAFDRLASEELGFKLDLKYEEMTSPKFYNFETDRIFASISLATLGALFTMSATDDHARLKACIKERFTSRSGFISFYDTSFEEWVAKPLDEWDHNETGTLLRAMLGEEFCEDRDLALYYATVGDEGGYTAHSEAVDWTKLDEQVAELRAEKLAEVHAHDPDYVQPPERCSLTPDLFT
ncbi:hypothetical protein ACWX0O_01670 [Nitrobacteraceae bacterium UC4449_H16]